MSECKINFQPEYEGKYCLGGKLGLCISISKKPIWLHRYCIKLFLGWEWIDNKGKDD